MVRAQLRQGLSSASDGQGEAWEKVHDQELPPVQLPLVPTDGRVSNSISEAANKIQEVVLKNPRGADETTDTKILTSRNLMLLTWWKVKRTETTKIMA